eukprot:GEMP01014143.1.p1 GENE.GEMP01014143.1~~GEMP01014143.1.p1  ORF type:complete len:432 (+),score=97.75 GEMP01014143.1:137-1432(+)
MLEHERIPVEHESIPVHIMPKHGPVPVAHHEVLGPQPKEVEVMGLWEGYARDGALPDTYAYVLIVAPFVLLLLMWVWLRLIWKASVMPSQNKDGKKKLLQEGEASQSQLIPYCTPWTQTFDLSFLISMILFFPFLYGMSYLTMPDILSNPLVWQNLFIKFGVMVCASLVGGVCTRLCAETDERGYIATGDDLKTVVKVKGFKVNYTRKIQHFAAYAVPILMSSPIPKGALELAWSDWCTLMGFVILIKPLREASSFFMMQFNALDRPEDRPHTLKWIVCGDIVPGMVVIIVFNALLGTYEVNGYNAADLTYIFVMVTGLGDGFAEPVGVHWGTHKYKVASIGGASHRLYTRSWEGSCTVAWFGYVFIATCWYLFPNATSFWVTFVLLPPVFAWAEAKSPHTMDTPCLFAVGGLWSWLALYIPPVLDQWLIY